MESDSGLHGDIPDGAEVSPLAESQPIDSVAELSENNVTSQDSEAVTGEESGKNEKSITPLLRDKLHYDSRGSFT